MPIPTVRPSSAEITALELRFDGPIPKQYLVPRQVLPTTHEGLQALLVDLVAEMDEARTQILNEAAVCLIQRDMETVRQAIAALPEIKQAAE